jgi:hypothetical protein
MKSDTDIGREIRDKVFEGNPYGQLSIMRKSIWAISVLTDLVTGDKEKAKEILIQALELNNMVESHLKPKSEDFLEVESHNTQETGIGDD